jgi:hypothetical protein
MGTRRRVVAMTVSLSSLALVQGCGDDDDGSTPSEDEAPGTTTAAAGFTNTPAAEREDKRSGDALPPTASMVQR